MTAHIQDSGYEHNGRMPTTAWQPRPPDSGSDFVWKPLGARADYDALYDWSITHIEDFWKSGADYFDVGLRGDTETVLAGDRMGRPRAPRRWRRARAPRPAVQLAGDDLFTASAGRLRRGIELGVANAVLIKPSQTGTVSHAHALVEQARAAGYATVLSARSGDTEDSWLADLAAGWRAGGGCQRR
jgi:hypothetical protein